MDILFPLMLRKSFSEQSSNSFSSNKILPEVSQFFLGSNPKIAKLDTDFPLPDSPTIPSISFVFKSKETSSTTLFSSESEKKEILKFNLINFL